MIDNLTAGAEAPVMISKVRPKAPNFVRDMKVLRCDDEVPDQSILFRDYVEVIDGVTVIYWRCPVSYDTCVGSRVDPDTKLMRDNWWWNITYNTLECGCVTWS